MMEDTPPGRTKPGICIGRLIDPQDSMGDPRPKRPRRFQRMYDEACASCNRDYSIIINDERRAKGSPM